jgi:hypothetical protein
LGGVPVSNANGIPITDAGGSVTVDGSVTILSGSVSGLLVGGVAASNANPVPVSQQGTVTTTTTLISGSQTGILIGANPVAVSNPFPITGSVGITAGIAVTTMPVVTTTTTLISGSQTGILMGANPVAASNPLAVQHSSGSQTGLLMGANPVAASNPLAVTSISGSQIGILVGANPAAVSNPFPINNVTGTVGIMSNGNPVATVNPLPVSSLTGSVVAVLNQGNPVALSNPLPVNVVYNAAKKTYRAASSGTVNVQMSPGSVTSIGYLWNPSTGSLQKEITYVNISLASDSFQNGWVQVRGNFVTAEAATPGVPGLIGLSTNRGNAATAARFMFGATAAPTRLAPDLYSRSVSVVTGAISDNELAYNAPVGGQGIILRSNTAEGFEFRAVAGGGTGSVGLRASMEIEWTEG